VRPRHPDMLGRMRRPWLALALFVAVAHADAIDDARDKNDLFLEIQKEELSKVPPGHFVVIVGGDTMKSGKELAPLLAMVDKSHADAKHRYVFRHGDEGRRKALGRTRVTEWIGGRQFFGRTGIRLFHDDRRWIIDRADGVVVGTSENRPSIMIALDGKSHWCQLDPLANVPLIADMHQRSPLFEIPGIASIVDEQGMDFGFRRSMVPVKLNNVDTPIWVEVWGGRDRLGNMERKLPNRNVKGNPWQLTKQWAADALQLRDPRLRERTLETLRKELAGDDPTRIQAALSTLARIGQLKYDKASFRPLVLPHFDSKISSVQIAAGYALYNTKREDGDLDLILAMVNDGTEWSGRGPAHLIYMFSDGEVTGAAGEAALKLIRNGHGRASNIIGGLWGAHVTPEIEAEVLKMVEQKGQRSDAIYFGLSTWRGKSRKVCDVLLDAATDPDFNVSGRAMWGLGHGVRPVDYSHVATGVIRLMESRDSPQIQLKCLRMLRTYASADHLLALEGFASNDMLSERVRAEANQIVELVRKRAR